MAELREFGVGLAVDDFGTGYSSLNSLRSFPMDRLKIDRSFVAGLDDARTRALTEMIVELGGLLDLQVVAEGIETEAQMHTVLELGCVFAQGYLLQRPAPAGTCSPIWRSTGAGSRRQPRSSEPSLCDGLAQRKGEARRLTPHFVGDLDHEAQLGGLLLDREGVALLGGREAALRRQAELVDVDVLRGLLDAPLDRRPCSRAPGAWR